MYTVDVTQLRHSCVTLDNQYLLPLCFASDSPSNGGGDAVCIQGFLPLKTVFCCV